MHMTDVTEHMTGDEFSAALDRAYAGESFVYARGRLSESLINGGGQPWHTELRIVAALAQLAASEQKVCLTQRRLVPYDPRDCAIFEYLATKCTVKQRGSMSQWPIPISSKSKSPRTESSDLPR